MGFLRPSPAWQSNNPVSVSQTRGLEAGFIPAVTQSRLIQAPPIVARRVGVPRGRPASPAPWRLPSSLGAVGVPRGRPASPAPWRLRSSLGAVGVPRGRPDSPAPFDLLGGEVTRSSYSSSRLESRKGAASTGVPAGGTLPPRSGGELPAAPGRAARPAM